MLELLETRRKQRKELEQKLSDRRDENVQLRKAIQFLIDKGQWDSDWGKLGFSKKENVK